MPEHVYTLTADDIRRLGGVTRRVERAPISGGPRKKGRYPQGGGGGALIPARATTAIPGATTSGTTITPGQGEAFLYSFDGTDLVLGDVARPVFNDLGEDAPAGTLLRLYSFAGRLWVAAWEC